MLKWTLIFLMLAEIMSAVGCMKISHEGGENTYLLPWPNAEGVYEVREVTLSTLFSPYEVKGTAAEIHFQSSLTAEGFGGAIARPHLTKSGHVFVPLDAESGLALSVYGQFERLYQYEQKLGTTSQLSWPRQVGVELGLNVPEGEAHNNAHYFQSSDSIGLLPYSLGHLPFALNQGIVAHEHFHAHFQHQVLDLLMREGLVVTTLENIFYPFFSFGVKPTHGEDVDDPRSPRSLNNIILRSWNEGLADLFAAIYTGKADFFMNSLPEIAQARALDQKLIPLWSSVDLQRRALNEKLTNDQLMSVAYSQGTALARLLYRRNEDAGQSPEKFIIEILNRLKNIPRNVNVGFTTTVMEFDQVVPVLLSGMAMSAQACEDLRRTISKPTLDRSFAQCTDH